MRQVRFPKHFMEVRYLPSESQWVRLRFNQLKSLYVPNTAMAVTIDAGEWNDIHPLEKKVVGERLALAASIKIEFDHIGNGLVAKGDGDLDLFAISGADRKFVWAEARIQNNHVVVWSREIKNPEYVRYAWADNPEGANLYNIDGLPASPFEAGPDK